MNTYTLINGYILDGSKEMKPTKGNVEVTNGKITKIGKFEPSTKEVIDCKEGYICPGLINLHAHLPSTGKTNPKKKLADKSKLVNFIKSSALTKEIGVFICKGSAKQALLSGTTTVRCVGGVGDVDGILRDRINAGKVLGPNLLVCNEAIGVKGGHMDGTVACAANTIEEAKGLVDKLVDQKVDLVKLMITGGVLDAKEVGHPGVLKMDPKMVKAVCDAAHKYKLIVAAHVESPEGVEVAIDNGVDTIEHGSLVSDEKFNKLKERDGSYVATFSPAIPLAKFDNSITGYDEVCTINTNVLLKNITEGANACLKLGVRVGLGTDAGCPYTTHYDFFRELVYFKKFCNVSNEFAIHTATKINAKIAGIDSYTGSIEVGKNSDIIVVIENPLKDLRALGNVEFVSTSLYHKSNPKVKHYKGYDELLDGVLDNL